MTPETVDPLELVWTLVALLGCLGAIGVAGAAWRDWAANRAILRADAARPVPRIPPREARRQRLVAATVVRNRVGVAALQAVFVLLGVRALGLPPNPAASDASTRLFGVLFILASLSVSASSIWDFIARYQFARLNRKDDTDG